MSQEIGEPQRLAPRTDAPHPRPATPSTSLVGAATLIALGTLLSSVLGLGRLLVMNARFGQTAVTGAWFAALRLPQTLSDLLIGGAVSAALIPLFAERSIASNRTRAAPALRTVLGAAVALLGLVGGLLWLAAPWLIPVLNPGFDGATQTLTIWLVRMLALWLPLSAGGAVLGAWLAARRRQYLPALTVGLTHLGMIAATLALGPRLGVGALAVGFIGGAALQVLCLGWVACATGGGALRGGAQGTARAARQLLGTVLRRYWPVALGLVVTGAVQNVDQWLLSQTYDPVTGMLGGPNVGALNSATAMIQFPVGLVASALALAALPDLARLRSDPVRFGSVASQGLRLGIFLMVPVTAEYLAAGTPLVALLFQHGAFTANDTARTTLALRGLAPELVAVAVEQVLTAVAFAQGRTVLPVLANLGGALAYGAVAFPLVHKAGMVALAAANTAQHTAVALILLAALGTRMPAHWWRPLAASAGRALLAGFTSAILSAPLSYLPHTTIREQLAAVAIPLLAGGAVYLLAALALRAPELAELAAMLRTRKE